MSLPEPKKSIFYALAIYLVLVMVGYLLKYPNIPITSLSQSDYYYLFFYFPFVELPMLVVKTIFSLPYSANAYSPTGYFYLFLLYLIIEVSITTVIFIVIYEIVAPILSLLKAAKVMVLTKEVPQYIGVIIREDFLTVLPTAFLVYLFTKDIYLSLLVAYNVWAFSHFTDCKLDKSICFEAGILRSIWISASITLSLYVWVQMLHLDPFLVLIFQPISHFLWDVAIAQIL